MVVFLGMWETWRAPKEMMVPEDTRDLQDQQVLGVHLTFIRTLYRVTKLDTMIVGDITFTIRKIAMHPTVSYYHTITTVASLTTTVVTAKKDIDRVLDLTYWEMKMRRLSRLRTNYRTFLQISQIATILTLPIQNRDIVVLRYQE
jgi:hypothetical protein